jgi:hypothetical protein
LAKKNLQRNWIFLLFSLFIANGLAYPAADRPIRQGSVEVLLGSYDMNEPRFEAVYPSGGLMGGLTLSSAIISNVNLYLEAKYYARQGELSFTKEKTDFYMVPISLGARYIFPLGLFNPYVGAGPDFYFYHEDNPIGKTLNYANGFHVTGGTYIRPKKSLPLMINLKVKYTWAKAEKEGIRVQLGGLEYGAGLVFTF